MRTTWPIFLSLESQIRETRPIQSESIRTISDECGLPITLRSHSWTNKSVGSSTNYIGLALPITPAIVFTSDHGYHLGEHTFWQKANLHEEVIRVPLVISVPGMKAGSTDSIAELVDLFPTLTELVGKPIPDEVQGQSLVPILKNPNASVKSNALSFSRKGNSLRTANWHYIRYDDKTVELYDMQNDPDEFHNLAFSGEHAATAERHENELSRRLAMVATSDGVVEADIVVYGGTSSGVIAAVQAKKMGKSVIIVGPDKHLGGLTSGGLGYTDTGNKAVIGGLSRDFYHRIWQKYQEPDAWRWEKKSEYGNKGQGTPAIDGKNRTMWIFEPHVAEQVFEDYVKEFQIPVYRDEWLDRSAGVKKEGAKIVSISMLSGKTFVGKMFIDATYEGDLLATAGIDFTSGERPTRCTERNGMAFKRASSIIVITSACSRPRLVPTGFLAILRPEFCHALARTRLASMEPVTVASRPIAIDTALPITQITAFHFLSPAATIRSNTNC